MFAELVRAHSRRWTHSDEILALILERIDDLANVTRFVNTEESKRPQRLPKPIRYPRPLPPAKPRRSTPDEIRRFFTRS